MLSNCIKNLLNLKGVIVKSVKNLPKKERVYFKHSRKLLLSRSCNLKTDKQKEELSYILINYFEDLRIAYKEKEDLLDILYKFKFIAARA